MLYGCLHAKLCCNSLQREVSWSRAAVALQPYLCAQLDKLRPLIFCRGKPVYWTMRAPVSRTSRNEPSETRYRTFRTIGRKTSGLRRRALLHTFVLGNGVSEHRANEMLTHSHDKRPAA